MSDDTKTVLFVDDEPNVLASLRRLLRKEALQNSENNAKIKFEPPHFKALQGASLKCHVHSDCLCSCRHQVLHLFWIIPVEAVRG